MAELWKEQIHEDGFAVIGEIGSLPPALSESLEAGDCVNNVNSKFIVVCFGPNLSAANPPRQARRPLAAAFSR
jgi:hypothetical protein